MARKKGKKVPKSENKAPSGVKQEVERLNKLIQANQLKEAGKLSEQLLEKYPEHPEVNYSSGLLCSALSIWEGAERCLEKAWNAGGRSVYLHLHLSVAKKKLEKYAQAEEHAERAWDRDPDNPDALHNLALLRRDQARIPEAVSLLDRAIEHRPDNIPTHFERLKLVTPSPDEPCLDFLERALQDENRPAEQRSIAGFALSGAYYGLGKNERCFAVLDQANKLLHPLRRASPPDPGTALDIWRRTCSREFFAKRRGFGLQNTNQAFIIGQTRTGKSLIESLLSCHPGVRVHGETQMFVRWANRAAGKSIQECAEYAQELSAGQSSRDARDCLEEMDLEPGRLHVGTFPGNMFRLGLIGLLFPDAPIIFCQRGLLDHGMSAYFRYYETGNKHTFDLYELGAYTRRFNDLVQFWRKILPNPVYVARYERTVDDPAQQARAVFDLLGLDFDLSYFQVMREHREHAMHLTPALSLDLPVPIRDDFVGVGATFSHHLGPFLKGYRSADIGTKVSGPIKVSRTKKEEREAIQ